MEKQKIFTMSQKDLFWLAGLIEGDGCFRYSGGTAIIEISMTDKDVVERVSEIFHSKSYECKPSKHKHYKLIYRTFIKGSRALLFMEELLPLMSRRRQEKIQEIQNIVSRKIGCKKTSEYDRLISFKEEIVNLKKSHTLREIASMFNSHYETIRQVIIRNPSPAVIQKILVTDQIKNAEWEWLVGLLEAEGSFVSGPPSTPNCPAIRIQMTDEDVICRASSLLMVNYHSFQPKKLNKSGGLCKKVYICSVRGRRSIDLMMKMKESFGERRREQIDKVINSYDFNLRQKRQEKQKKINDMEIVSAKNMIRSGMSLRAVSRHFGVHHTTLLAAFRRLGKNKN